MGNLILLLQYIICNRSVEISFFTVSILVLLVCTHQQIHVSRNSSVLTRGVSHLEIGEIESVPILIPVGHPIIYLRKWSFLYHIVLFVVVIQDMKFTNEEINLRNRYAARFLDEYIVKS